MIVSNPVFRDAHSRHIELVQEICPASEQLLLAAVQGPFFGAYS